MRPTLALLALLIASPCFAADISQEYRYQVLVKESVNGIEYRDAIYYTPTQWQTLRQADVNAEITRRKDNFRNALENPPPYVPPTRAELQAQRAALQEQITELDAEISRR